jgi:hypothetical protein
MSALDRDAVVRWLPVALVVAYVALIAAELVTGDATAGLAAELLFGVVTIGVGGWIATSEPLTPLTSTAAASLVGAGLAALGGVVTGRALFGGLSNVFLLVGVVAYLLHRRRR